mmetsp:Transcript_31809/g.84702  ORF Transcript_31809/g.84702 Transcript_31809/m.84702 type:complete len:93 (-) Transcript_31809:244-522(-)
MPSLQELRQLLRPPRRHDEFTDSSGSEDDIDIDPEQNPMASGLSVSSAGSSIVSFDSQGRPRRSRRRMAKAQLDERRRKHEAWMHLGMTTCV